MVGSLMTKGLPPIGQGVWNPDWFRNVTPAAHRIPEKHEGTRFLEKLVYLKLRHYVSSYSKRSVAGASLLSVRFDIARISTMPGLLHFSENSSSFMHTRKVQLEGLEQLSKQSLTEDLFPINRRIYGLHVSSYLDLKGLESIDLKVLESVFKRSSHSSLLQSG